MAVPEQVVNALSRLGRGFDLDAQRGDDGAQPAGVEFGAPVPGPPVGQVDPGTVDGLGDIAQVLLGVVDVNMALENRSAAWSQIICCAQHMIWTLARDRTDALALLDDVAADAGADASVAVAAAGLGETLRGGAGAGMDPAHRPLSDRELEVLARLERQSDKEIAQVLKLSHDGVRYRVRGIFAKLGARGRLDAVHRARARGILPAAEEAPEADA